MGDHKGSLAWRQWQPRVMNTQDQPWWSLPCGRAKAPCHAATAAAAAAALSEHCPPRPSNDTDPIPVTQMQELKHGREGLQRHCGLCILVPVLSS